MASPLPVAGDIVRYSYLWRSEADRGRTEGSKDRPCAVVLAVLRANGLTRIVIAPVTHSAPTDPATAIEIPTATKARLGLDMDRSWIIVNEVNEFTWPGPDVRIVPHGSQANPFIYGQLPVVLAKSVIQGV